MIEAWKSHIDNSIEKALKHESFIDKEILDIKGFSTGVMRRLISNLCHFQKDNLTYLEVGLYAGATYCAAINNNDGITAIGVEDFSQPFGDGAVFEELKDNVQQFGWENFAIFTENFFSISPSRIKHPVDIFFYDGEHSYESQSKALPHALPMLADEFVFIVDDYDWVDVQMGTKDSIADLLNNGDIEVHKTWKLSDNQADGPNWHNGVAILLCRKPA